MSLKKQLFDAIDRNNFERVTFFIEKANVPVSLMNANDQTLAHIAAKNNNVQILKYFLEKDPSMLYRVDRFYSTILHLAAVKGSLDVVKYLVEEQNFDVSIMGGRDKDRTALHMAIEFNQLAILRYFIEERNMDLNVPNAEQTQPPIFMAIKSRHWEVIEYMIEDRKANLTLLNSRNENILFPVVRQGLTAFLKYLLEQLKVSYDVNWRNVWGETVLHVAANLHRLYIIKYLVEEKHADMDLRRTNTHLKDADGFTPLELAREDSLVEYLTSVTKPRDRRHVDTYLPAALPSEYSQRGHILSDRPPSLEHANGNMSNTSCSALFHLHSFLWLAKLAVRGGRRSENMMDHNLSPLSSIRSRMSPVAIEVIDGGSNFRS